MNSFELPKNKTLDIQAFSNILELKNLQNSYKIYWFNAIFEEIKKGNKNIAFKTLVLKMITKSWYSLIEYKLNFGIQDKLNIVVNYIYDNYNFNKEINENTLYDNLQKIKNEDFNKSISFFYHYVPYRLLTPFFTELKGIKDSKKNKAILELSQNSNKSLYKINDEKKSIQINENWFEYIYENQIIIEGWLKSKLIYFLQTRNPNIPAIPFKIEPPIKRNLSKANKYWTKIISLTKLKNIYNEEILTEENILSIDHFIPWSFVLHDELWNLTPTSKEINSQKSDKLPNLKKYLNKFCDLQYKSITTAMKNDFPKNEIIDYYSIIKENEINSKISKEIFTSKLKQTINPIYQIALNSGFMMWEDKGNKT